MLPTEDDCRLASVRKSECMEGILPRGVDTLTPIDILVGVRRDLGVGVGGASGND